MIIVSIEKLETTFHRYFLWMEILSLSYRILVDIRGILMKVEGRLSMNNAHGKKGIYVWSLWEGRTTLRSHSSCYNRYGVCFVRDLHTKRVLTVSDVCIDKNRRRKKLFPFETRLRSDINMHAHSCF